MIIGCHLSVAKGYHHMGKEALSIGANTFQFFTRNPRGGSSKAIDLSDATSLKHLMMTHNFGTILAHAPYTLNPCSTDDRIRRFAYQVFEEDLEKLEVFPGTYYNFHPGSHVGLGVEKGIHQIIELLNHTMTPNQSTIVLLETMSGKGTEVGSKFEELKAIIDGVNVQDKLGVCLDTCHVYDAGYDIVQNLEGVLAEFDRIIGLNKLKAIHLNDSKNPFNSHKDRHEKIGQGYIGYDAVKQIINHPLLRDLPFYLETPNELSGYKAEIAYLRENAISF